MEKNVDVIYMVSWDINSLTGDVKTHFKQGENSPSELDQVG